MKQDLIDLILGDLEPAREEELRAQIRESAELQSELADLEALFGFMRRGEQIESDPSVRETVMAAARKATAPSLGQRIAAIPALIRYRFQHSRGFRVAAASLALHLVAMAVLFQIFVQGGKQPLPTNFQLSEVEAPHVEVRPSNGFVLQLRYARASRSVRLKKYGVDGQGASIRAGLDALMAQQKADGSWGTFAATCDAALALMAENVRSSEMSVRGQALERAMRYIRHEVADGSHGARALEALIEDWALNHAELPQPDRTFSVECIRMLLDAGGNSQVGLNWATRAGFGAYVRESFVEIQDGPVSLPRQFRGALDRARKGDAAAILLLQSPYRA